MVSCLFPRFESFELAQIDSLGLTVEKHMPPSNF